MKKNHDKGNPVFKQDKDKKQAKASLLTAVCLFSSLKEASSKHDFIAQDKHRIPATTRMKKEKRTSAVFRHKMKTRSKQRPVY